MPSYQVDPASSRDAPQRLGRYELVGQLATGGMAEIHLARLAGEAGFEKIVVVKRLLPELVASPAYVAMFLDEGKLVSRLDHPNICEVFELGRDGAEYYIAMPYLDGVALHELIARPRDPDRITQIRVAAGVIVQACAGLHHAHELRDADGAPANLVHRDVSPSNLFVTSSGAVKVLDFGVAKVRGGTQTEANTIKGKAQYMAPEQLLGDPLDRRCDVFALGIVMFEAVAHQRLFKRQSDYLTARAILEEPIPRADSVDPAVPAPLADAIAMALARDKAARFSDMRAFADAIIAAMAPHDGIATPPEIAAAVVGTDELSAMRTRQARVLGEARLRTGSLVITSAHGDEATRRLREHRHTQTEPPTEVVGPRTFTHRVHVKPRTGLVLAIGIVAAAAIVVAIVAWMMGGTTTDDTRVAAAASGGSAQPNTAPVAPPTGSAPPPSIPHDDVAPPPPPPPDPASPALAIVSDPASPDRGSAAPHVTKPPKDRTRPPKPKQTPGSAATPAIDEPLPPGTFSIDSKPYATITVDGRDYGITPLYKITIAPGRHKIRAALKDGRHKDLAIDVPAGGAAQPIQLAW